MASARSTEPLRRRATDSDAAAARLRHLQALTEAALAHLDLDELLDELLARLSEILAVDTAAVLLFDEVAGELVGRASKGIGPGREHRIRVALGRGFAGRVAAERRPIFLPEVTERDVTNPVLIERGIRSLLGVPLLIEGRVLGVVHVGTLEPREFTGSDADLLQLAANRMALAIEHARLYESERDARAAAERAVEQIRRIHAVTDVALGHFSLDQELLTGVLRRLTEALEVDTAAILLFDAEGKQLVARAAKGIEEEVEQGVTIPVGKGFAGRIAAERRPIFLRNVDHTTVVNPILLEKGIRSLLGVPLMVEGRVLGIMHVGTLYPREFTADDTALLELAADRIAIAIDRARQHSVARTLQERLLPARLPVIVGLELAARYVPGVDDTHVGGDWYDVIALPHGRVGLVMGDVVSRGARAAAAMGHMRTALRAYAHDGSPPGVVLERLNDLVRLDEEREMATTAYAILDPASGALTYALAGHPPPVVLDRDGATRLLEDGRSGPVGVAGRGRYAEAEDRLHPGETLLLYTDGLVERRDEPLDHGLGKLREVVTRVGGEPDRLCEQLVGELGGVADDVAVLAARLTGPAGERLELRFRAVPESLSAMRRSLGAWLAAVGADDDETYDVLVAVGEAAANAVEHAYGPVDEDFELTAELNAGEVELTVADRGRWRPARGENRGRGTTLMNDLMDRVDFETGEHGTLVRMRRRLGAERGS